MAGPSVWNARGWLRVRIRRLCGDHFPGGPGGATGAPAGRAAHGAHRLGGGGDVIVVEGAVQSGYTAAKEVLQGG